MKKFTFYKKYLQNFQKRIMSLKLREEIEEKYKWNLKTIYEDQESWKKEKESLESLDKSLESFLSLKGI
jgi:DNA repair ATPase RecN